MTEKNKMENVEIQVTILVRTDRGFGFDPSEGKYQSSRTHRGDFERGLGVNDAMKKLVATCVADVAKQVNVKFPQDAVSEEEIV